MGSLKVLQSPLPTFYANIVKTFIFLLLFIILFLFVAFSGFGAIDNRGPIWGNTLQALFLSMVLAVGIYKIWKNFWLPALFLILWSGFNLLDAGKIDAISYTLYTYFYIVLLAASALYLFYSIWRNLFTSKNSA